MSKVSLTYEQGTLLLPKDASPWVENLSVFLFDPRTDNWRAPAFLYRDIILLAIKQKLPLFDAARKYKALTLSMKESIIPREHQSQALSAWTSQQSRGVVSLPTGAGKTILAVMAIAKTQRPTLIVVPTIDLMHQWQATLRRFFEGEVGMVGGGCKEILDLTVATYESAAIYIERLGSQFGLLIFDECHHLPTPQYKLIAEASIAPFRLGLSATVERPDGKEEIIYRLVGDLCYQSEIREMVQRVLAPYDVICVQVPLTDTENEAYLQSRAIYTGFIRKHHIDFSSPDGWNDFVRKTARHPEGKKAMEAYREQKKLSQGAEGKISELWNILQKHRGERVLVFTQDNATAYQIGREFILPVITHQTKPKERKKFLDSFRSGELDVLVTSKVLNEGVDVPEASVGVVISGSGAVREHVQRLGRILRHQEGKRAVLYEVVSKNTSEYYVNQRRRNHNAYQRPSQVFHSRG